MKFREDLGAREPIGFGGGGQFVIVIATHVWIPHVLVTLGALRSPKNGCLIAADWHFILPLSDAKDVLSWNVLLIEKATEH
jgi:hypothetical protein